MGYQTLCGSKLKKFFFSWASPFNGEKSFPQFTFTECLEFQKYYCENRIYLHIELAEIFYAKQFDQVP